MGSLTHLDRRRVGLGSLVGFLAGAGVALFRPPLAPFLGAAVAGLVVGLRLDSRLDEFGIEAFLAGCLTTALLYAGVVGYALAFFAGSLSALDAAYVAGTYGWFAAVLLIPVVGCLGFVGGALGRRLSSPGA
jgi:hypothetical protein